MIAVWSGMVCPLRRLGGRHDRASVLLTVGLTRSREAAKGNALGRCSVFGQASRECESAGVSSAGLGVFMTLR